MLNQVTTFLKEVETVFNLALGMTQYKSSLNLEEGHRMHSNLAGRKRLGAGVKP